MSVLARDFQVLLVSGYARRIVETKVKWDILKTCIMFYNGLRFHVEIPKIAMETEEAVESQCHPVSWSNCDGTTFSVRRGPNYTDGQKEQSKAAMYTAFRLDCYKVPQKINGLWRYTHPDIASDFCEQIALYSLPPNCPLPLPPLCIINIMLPNYKPEMGKTTDGPGYGILMVAHLSRELFDQLTELAKNPEAEVDGLQVNPVQLLLNFMKSDESQTDKVRERMKLINRCMNPKTVGFGWALNKALKKYNAKPFLARTSTTFYYEPGLYFGIDIDISLWGYPAKKGLASMWEDIPKMIFDVGFVIEGRDDHELPEQLVCGLRISKMDFDTVAHDPPPDLIEKHLEQMEKDKAAEEAAAANEAEQDAQ